MTANPTVQDDGTVAFLKELEVVSRKHGMHVHYCDGSIYNIEENEMSEDYGYVDHGPELHWEMTNKKTYVQAGDSSGPMLFGLGVLPLPLNDPTLTRAEMIAKLEAVLDSCGIGTVYVGPDMKDADEVLRDVLNALKLEEALDDKNWKLVFVGDNLRSIP